MGFQRTIQNYQAPGVPGDFASLNPFASVLGGPGNLTAPAGGLLVGNFAWVGPNGEVSQSYVAGYQIGFLGRNEQALITEFLGESTMLVPEGFMVTLFNEGDFWALFEAGAQVGQNVYADPNDGSPVAGATAPALGTGTGSAGFDGTCTIVDGETTLTVAAATHGILSVGDVVTATDVPAGTTIVAQLTGAAGGVGTYQMSAAATATVDDAEAITSTSLNMLMTAVADGAFSVGDQISGTDVAAGTTITGQATPFAGVATLASTTALTVTSVQAGTDLLRLGATVVGNGIPAGTTISAQTSGAPGGVGIYTLSAAATATGAGVAITSGDSAGATGLYQITGPQAFGASSAPETITVPGTAQPTGFKVAGTFSPPASGPGVGGQLAKISTF